MRLIVIAALISLAALAGTQQESVTEIVAKIRKTMSETDAIYSRLLRERDVEITRLREELKLAKQPCSSKETH